LSVVLIEKQLSGRLVAKVGSLPQVGGGKISYVRYAWEESGGPVHKADPDPRDANVTRVRALTKNPLRYLLIS